MRKTRIDADQVVIAWWIRAHVSPLERGVANPRVDVLARLAVVLGVPMVALFAEPESDEERPEPLPGGRRRCRDVAPRSAVSSGSSTR
jgi:transcriptional regulator with XRE-family HTH domain